jgi:hypothetical protein
MLPAVDAIQSKGFTLRSALAFVETRHGLAGKQQLLAALPQELGEAVSHTILSSSWYPFRLQVELYEAIDRVFGRGDLALCKEIGRFTSEHELTTIHKLFLKVASLELWMKSAGMMWGVYYSAGRLSSAEFGPASGVLTVSDFNPISAAFCADFAGWLERTAEMSGKRGVDVRHAACVLTGAPACRYEATWQA